MKKIFITAALAGSAVAFAQSGKVGVNESAPQATLDIKPTTVNAADGATTNEGILIPRLSAARVAATATPVVGTLVYVNTAPAGANAASFSDTTTGFYYWNGTIWTKMGAGTATVTTASNGLTATGSNVTLGGTLTQATTVNQANNNLTFTTGTGQFQVNGTTNMQGSVYHKTRAVTGAITSVNADDYMLIKTDSGAVSWNLGNQPDGRKICVFNNAPGTTGSTLTITPQPRGLYGGSIYQNSGNCYISYGGVWFGSEGGN